MKNLGDVNSSVLRKITDLQFDFISRNLESGIEQAKSLSSMKDAKDIFASSAEFVSDYNEKMTGFTNQAVEILAQSRDEATVLFEKTIAPKAAPAKAKAAATKKLVKKAA